MTKSISTIIPAYNEEDNLIALFNETQSELEKLNVDYEIIIVDDGSVDKTQAIARSLRLTHPNVEVLTHPSNMGSGMAIRSGISKASKDLIIYIPADGQFEIKELKEFIETGENSQIVIGARMERSDYSWFRLLSSKVFIILVNYLFQQDFKDVNWVHLWQRDIFQTIQPRSTGVFLLEEIIVRARQKGYTVTEINSRYKPRIGGQAKGGNILVILKTIHEMIRLWLDLYR